MRLTRRWWSCGTHGITRALVDGSGDIVVGDPPPGEKGWRIGVAPLEAKNGPPSRYLTLANCAVTTSGDAWQYVELDGKRYSHILDPKTGLGPDRSQPGDRGGAGRHLGRQPHQGSGSAGSGTRIEVYRATPARTAVLVLRQVDGQVQMEETENFKAFE